VKVKTLPERPDENVTPSVKPSTVGTNHSKGSASVQETPLSLEDSRRLVKGYVHRYNDVRLNSAIGYITPKDVLVGHQQGDSGRAGSEVGGGKGTAEEPPPAAPVEENDAPPEILCNDSQPVELRQSLFDEPSSYFSRDTA
jgi:hypothetical protein